VQTRVETAWSERERRKTIQRQGQSYWALAYKQAKEEKIPSTNCNWLKASLRRHSCNQSTLLQLLFSILCNNHGVGSGFKRAHRGVECPWRAVSWELAQGRKRRPHFLWRLKMSQERLAIHHSWPPPFYLVPSITLVDTSRKGTDRLDSCPCGLLRKKKVQWDWLEKTKRKSRFKQHVQNAVTKDCLTIMCAIPNLFISSTPNVTSKKKTNQRLE
jgi:hypothetical protein